MNMPRKGSILIERNKILLTRLAIAESFEWRM